MKGIWWIFKTSLQVESKSRGSNRPYGNNGVSGGNNCSHILKSLFLMAILKQFQHRSWMAFFTQSTVKCWSWLSKLKFRIEKESRLSTGLPVRRSWKSSGRMPKMSTVTFLIDSVSSKWDLGTWVVTILYLIRTKMGLNKFILLLGNINFWWHIGNAVSAVEQVVWYSIGTIHFWIRWLCYSEELDEDIVEGVQEKTRTMLWKERNLQPAGTDGCRKNHHKVVVPKSAQSE